jgi:hypothetical protein
MMKHMLSVSAQNFLNLKVCNGSLKCSYILSYTALAT